MKKYDILKLVLAVVIVMMVAGLIFLVWFYWNNLRGAWPAVLPPSGDVTKNANTTGLPLKIPDGFTISIFAKNLNGPRVITFDPDGNMLVSLTSAGKVVALPDKNADSAADQAVDVVSGLNRPHGLAFRCEDGSGARKCKLYVAQTGEIDEYDYDRENMKASNKIKIADLPAGGAHFTRTIGFGPDGRLYVSVGSDCNVCVESDPKRAKIFSMNPDGSDFREFARGLRNSVFFTWSPENGKMFATEMGRDLLGDDLPPDEINIIEEGDPSKGLRVNNYGWPNCYGKNIHDAEFDKNTYIRNPCMEPFEVPSYIDIPAHSAPLGLAFVPEDTDKGEPEKGSAWPEEYWYNLFVAYHGSWNRSVPTGYKVVRYKMDKDGKVLGTEDFITGWLTDEGALGRPVDIVVQSGGIMFVSDDKAGVVYKVKYNGKS